MLILSRPYSSSAKHFITDRLRSHLSRNNVDCKCIFFGSSKIANVIFRLAGQRRGKKIIDLGLRPMWENNYLRKVNKNDIVWMYTNGLLTFNKNDCRLEKNINFSIGAKYVFYLPDAWPLAGDFSADACSRRVAIADIVTVPTPQLQNVMREHYPGVQCELAEEAIDTDTLAPAPVGDAKQNLPIVVWTGPDPYKSELPALYDVFASVAKKVPFLLRIVTGPKRPDINLPVPWDWRPYSVSGEAENLNAHVAVAYYSDSPYNQCKGNYKVKTYMAAGQAVLTTPVGYNNTMIQHGVNGMLASSLSEWHDILVFLLKNPDFAKKLGQRARRDAVSRYSYTAMAPKYLEILKRHFPDLR